MFRFEAFYAVPGWMRLLTGGAALVAGVSMPLLVGSASHLEMLLTLVAGAFSASIAIFGRLPDMGRS